MLWALTLPKATVPGPLTLDQVRVSVLPGGQTVIRGGAVQRDRRRQA